MTERPPTDPDGNTAADTDLDRRLAALVREAPPPAGAWAGIRRRIDPRYEAAARNRFDRPAAAAAAAAVAAMALVAVLVLEGTNPDPGSSRDPAAVAAIEPGRAVVQAEVAAMRRTAPVVTGGLDASLPLAEAWADNQAAIEQLEAALDADPDNYLLLEFLAEARLRQTRLLNAALVGNGPTPTPTTRMNL